MKIKKLVEEKQLFEAEENDVKLDEIDPKTDSTSDIATAVENEIEDLSNGEVSIDSQQAHEIAQITKDVAYQVDASQVAFVLDDSDFEDVKIENRLTRALDAAYETAKITLKDDSKNGANFGIDTVETKDIFIDIEEYDDFIQ